MKSEFVSRLSTSSAATNKGASHGDRRRSASQSALHKLASRLLVFYVRHAALIRPLTESGRLRLAKDLAEFELGTFFAFLL